MLTQEDLPEPWRLGRSPIPEAEARAIEIALGYDQPSFEFVSWDEIRHELNGQRALLRVVAEDPTLAGALISGVVLLPAAEGSLIEAKTLRELPLGSIQTAASRRAHSLRVDSVAALNAVLAAGMEEGIGSNDGSDGFYARVARDWLSRYAEGDLRPTDSMAREESVPLRTAQRWVTEARKRGFVPAGVRGRSGGKRG